MKQNSNLPPLILNPKSAKHFEGLKPNSAPESYRPAKQKRSAKSEMKLLAAAEHLFAEKGYLGTKIADIIQLSGCSIGSFYHRFGDKEGLARVLVDRFVAETSELIRNVDLSSNTHGNLHGMLRFFTTLAFDTMTRRLGAYRAAQRLAETTPEIWWAETGGMANLANQAALQVLPEYADEIRATDQAAAMTNAIQLILMIGLQTRLGAGPLFPKDTATLIEVIVRGAEGILCLEDS